MNRSRIVSKKNMVVMIVIAVPIFSQATTAYGEDTDGLWWKGVIVRKLHSPRAEFKDVASRLNGACDIPIHVVEGVDTPTVVLEVQEGARLAEAIFSLKMQLPALEIHGTRHGIILWHEPTTFIRNYLEYDIDNIRFAGNLSDFLCEPYMFPLAMKPVLVHHPGFPMAHEIPISIDYKCKVTVKTLLFDVLEMNLLAGEIEPAGPPRNPFPGCVHPEAILRTYWTADYFARRRQEDKMRRQRAP